MSHSAADIRIPDERMVSRLPMRPVYVAFNHIRPIQQFILIRTMPECFRTVQPAAPSNKRMLRDVGLTSVPLHALGTYPQKTAPCDVLRVMDTRRRTSAARTDTN